MDCGVLDWISVMEKEIACTLDLLVPMDLSALNNAMKKIKHAGLMREFLVRMMESFAMEWNFVMEKEIVFLLEILVHPFHPLLASKTESNVEVI